MKFSTICLYTFIITSFIFPITNDVNAFNTDRFIEGFKHPKKEVALTYQSDSFSIIRGSAEFHFSPGEITIFNFGGGVDCAIHYKGNCRFVYNPPDNVERAQLIKFFETEKIDNTAKSVSILFTVPLEVPFDSFTKPVSGKNSKAAGKISKAVKDAYNNIGIDILDWLLNDLLTDEPGTYFYADFKLDKIGHIAFCENPYSDDYFQLYKLLRSAGVETYNYISGYSPDNDLPSYRGVMPIDIIHYDINSKIEGNGKMIVNCRIHYTPLRNNRKYLMFLWYKKNELHCAFDSNGDSLKIIHRNIKDDEDYDIGIILNDPTQLGKNDYIDINFECESLDNLWGVYYFKGQTVWYPRSIIRDLTTYRLKYNYPKKFEVVSCGNLVDLQTENGRTISVWNVDRPVNYVSFNIGAFNSKEIIEDNLPVVRVYLAKYIDHEDIAHFLLSRGVLSTRDMLANVGADVVNSLAFFSSIITPCPFDTIKVSEIPYRHGQCSPGLIHLSWDTYQMEDMEGWEEKFRAREVSHQWWGHMLDNESYRDTWIIKGLAGYCGYWFYQMSSKNKKACNNMLEYIRFYIKRSAGKKSIKKIAGPVILGHRLNSTQSDDYWAIVYHKGSYIFHMIRYLLHDYKTGSDDAFALFLNDLIIKFKNKPITTNDLQKILESHTGIDMSWFFNQWVYGTDIPKYHFSFNAEKTREGKYKVKCCVKQSDVSGNFKMIVPLTVKFDNDRYIHFKIWVDKPEEIIELPLLPYKPKEIILNTYDAVLATVKY